MVDTSCAHAHSKNDATQYGLVLALRARAQKRGNEKILPNLPTRFVLMTVEIRPMTPTQRYRLVEIAHETVDPAIRAAALGLLGGGCG